MSICTVIADVRVNGTRPEDQFRGEHGRDSNPPSPCCLLSVIILCLHAIPLLGSREPSSVQQCRHWECRPVERPVSSTTSFSRSTKILGSDGADKQHPQSDPAAQGAWKKTPRRNHPSQRGIRAARTAEAHVPGRGAVWPHLAHTILLVSEAVSPTHARHGDPGVYLCVCSGLTRRRRP